MPVRGGTTGFHRSPGHFHSYCTYRPAEGRYIAFSDPRGDEIDIGGSDYTVIPAAQANTSPTHICLMQRSNYLHCLWQASWNWPVCRVRHDSANRHADTRAGSASSVDSRSDHSSSEAPGCFETLISNWRPSSCPRLSGLGRCKQSGEEAPAITYATSTAVRLHT